MKLVRVAMQQFLHEGRPLASVVLDGTRLVCLVLSTQDWRYRLVLVDEAGVHRFELSEVPPHEHGSQPALMAADGGGVAVIADRDEVLWYPTLGGPVTRLPIKNRRLLREIVPAGARVMAPTASASDSSRYPIAFEHDTSRTGHPRHWAVLDLDLQRQRASWLSWGSLSADQLENYEHAAPPKVEAMISRADSLLVSTTGGRTTSVNKWGMDYYALMRTSPSGDSASLVWGGSHGVDDRKKHGVHVLLTASCDYAVLTPLFSNGAWKGKQKLLDLDSRGLIDVTLPPGAGKYARIVQHASDIFWIWNADQDAAGENRWTVTLARATAAS